MIALYFIISGALLYVAEPPLGLGPLAFVTLIPLLHATQKSSSYARAALGGFVAGSAFFIPALSWLTSTTVLGWAALSLYCASYFAIFAMLGRATLRVLPLAAGWTLLEYVRGAIALAGFPWVLLSHSQYNFTYFTQILDLIGGYGLSGVLVAINVLLYKALTTRRRKPAIAAAGVLAGICIYGYVRVHSIPLERSHRVAMVQASVPQDMKEALQGTYDPKGVLSRYLKASASIPRDQGIDLLVWPETVVLSPYMLNVDPSVLDDEYAEDSRFAQSALGALAQSYDAYFLAGSTSFLPAEHGYVSDLRIAAQIPDRKWRKRFNSSYLVDPGGRYVDRYDKMHLVPFGEYIPLREIFPFLEKLVPFDASLSPGERQTIFKITAETRLLRFGVLICYEDTDSALARRLRLGGADFFVNVSNDAWFGLSELDQHFVAARFRAVENRVGVVRSGNNGLSGIIDPLGRAEILLGKNEIGSAAGDVWVTNAYPLYTQLGDWPAVITSAVILVVRLTRRKCQAAPPKLIRGEDDSAKT